MGFSSEKKCHFDTYIYVQKQVFRSCKNPMIIIHNITVDKIDDDSLWQFKIGTKIQWNEEMTCVIFCCCGRNGKYLCTKNCTWFVVKQENGLKNDFGARIIWDHEYYWKNKKFKHKKTTLKFKKPQVLLSREKQFSANDLNTLERGDYNIFLHLCRFKS